MLFNGTSQQVAERWPLFFVCPSFSAGAPGEFSQRDPRDVLLPGGGDISQSCLADQLSLRSPGLYEESLLQHWDHVSKRNKFVGPIHRQGYTDIHYVMGWIWTCGTCRSHRSLGMQMNYVWKAGFRPVGWPMWMKLPLIIGKKEHHVLWAREMFERLEEQQLCSSHMDPSPRRCTDGVN